MNYVDFILEIGPRESGRNYPVKVVSSPAGEAEETMQFPFDDLLLDNRLKSLEIALLRSGGERRKLLSPKQQEVQEFGRQLFDALITGEVRGRYDVTCTQADAAQPKVGVRLKLRINAPELSALPWEFMFDSRDDDYVCLSRRTPVVRYPEMPRPIPPLKVTLPLRLLGMVAAPRDLPALDVEREKGRIEQATRRLCQQGLLDVTWLPGGTWRDLHRAMRQGPWHVFHFIGHGGFDQNRDEGIVAFEDDAQNTHRIAASDLGMLLKDNALSLVVLNSCEGARGGKNDVFSSTAAVLVRKGVPAVLAMQYEITDGAAIAFAENFYDSLAAGMPVDAAVADARMAIKLSVGDTVEWGTPVLYTRSPDGVLFELPAGAQRSQVLASGAHEEPLKVVAEAGGAARPADVARAERDPQARNGLGERPQPAAVPQRRTPPRAAAQSKPAPPTQTPGKGRLGESGRDERLLRAFRDPRYWTASELPVLVLAACADPATLRRLESLLDVYQRPLPVFDTCDDDAFATAQSFRFHWQPVATAHLIPKLEEFLSRDDPRLAVIVSDELVEGGGPSELARSLREMSLGRPHFCGLLGLVEGAARRTLDVDRVLRLDDLNDATLRAALTKVADGLRLKAPSGPTKNLDDDEAVVVRLAQTESDLRACFHLRHLVYDRMGYLDDATSNCPSRLEIDHYDATGRTLHFIAHVLGGQADGEVVGTVRLILARDPDGSRAQTSIGCPPDAALARQAALSRRIAEQAAREGCETSLGKLAAAGNFASLPVLQSTEFSRKAGDLIRRDFASFGELSRLVVAPRYRGLSVSRMLVRAVIAVSWDLGKPNLLLECIPAHCEMYRGYSFTKIEGTHTRAQELDQVAVAMRLSLGSFPMQRAMNVAKKDLDMIYAGPPDPGMLLGGKHLCLCNRFDCWRSGRYSLRINPLCPLGERHLNGAPASQPRRRIAGS